MVHHGQPQIWRIFAADFIGFWRIMADFGEQIKSAMVWQSPVAADFIVDRLILWGVRRTQADFGELWLSPPKLEFNPLLY